MTQASLETSRLPHVRREDLGRIWPMVSALFVALVLGTAIYGKVIFPFLAGTTEKADGSGVINNVPLPGGVDWLIAIAEVALIGVVLAFHRRWFTWGLVTLVFATFAGYTTHRLMIGASCGCFGELEIFGVAMTSRVTLGLDLICVAIGLSLAARPSSRLMTSVSSMVTVLAAAAAVGAGASALTAPPAQGTAVAVADDEQETDQASSSEPAPRNSVDILMDQPFMEEVVTAGEDDPVWLVYIYSDECPTCQEHLRYMRDYQQRRPNDPALRIKTVSMQRMQDELDLPIWSWPSVPTLIRVEEGKITQQYPVEQLPTPEEVRADLSPDGDPLMRLKEIEKLQEVFNAPEDGPTYLLYLYNPECPMCVEHLGMYRAFEEAVGENHPLVRVRTISMFEIENRLGIPLYRWPSVPFTARFEGGEMKQKYLADETPDAFRLLEERGGNIEGGGAGE